MTTMQQSPRVLIVGVGPGLGTSLARRFGREGLALTLVARNEQTLTGIADALREEDIDAEIAVADAADAHTFRATLEVLAKRITPTVIIYNAAVLAPDGVLTSDTDYLVNAFTVDVLGAIIAAQVFTPAMQEARRGTVLVTGGGLALQPHAQLASLSIGKAALRAAASVLHDDLKLHGVHATGVTIAGAIEAGTALDPDRIADAYWHLHTQPAPEWTAELIFDGQ